jgi:hypothetical protein
MSLCVTTSAIQPEYDWPRHSLLTEPSEMLKWLALGLRTAILVGNVVPFTQACIDLLGCACDIPAHTYTYPFEPNPDWSTFYAGSAEISAYFTRFYEKYHLKPFVKLEHKVLSAEWDDAKGLCSCAPPSLSHIWRRCLTKHIAGDVTLQHDDEVFQDHCHVLVNGTGVINRWKCRISTSTRCPGFDIDP